MSITWDWKHSNEVDFTLSTKFDYHPVRIENQIACKDVKAYGVCSSKCAFWIKRCQMNGGPPLRRADFDGAKSGVGLSPASLAIQAVHVRNARDFILGKLSGSDDRDEQVQGIAEKYDLTATRVGHDTTPFSSAWLNLAWGSKGGLLIGIQGADFSHSLAFWRDALFQAFFDPENGQYARMNSAEFKSNVKDYLDTRYSGFTEWWVYKLTKPRNKR